MLNRRQQWRRTTPRAEDESSEKDPFGFLSGLPVPLGNVFNSALPLSSDPAARRGEGGGVAYSSLFLPQPSTLHSLPPSPPSPPRASGRRQGGLKGSSHSARSVGVGRGPPSDGVDYRVRWHPTVRFRVIPGPDDLGAHERAAVWWSAHELRGFAKEEILRRRYAALQRLNWLDSDESEGSADDDAAPSADEASNAPQSPTKATLRAVRAASDEGASSGAAAARRSWATPVPPAVASAAAIEVVRPYADYGPARAPLHARPATPPFAAADAREAACADATVVADADLPLLAAAAGRRKSASRAPVAPAVAALAARAHAAGGALPANGGGHPAQAPAAAPVFAPLASSVSPADLMADLAGPLAALAAQRGLDPQQVLDATTHHALLEGDAAAGLANSRRGGSPAPLADAPPGAPNRLPLLAGGVAHGPGVARDGAATPPLDTHLNVYSPRPRPSAAGSSLSFAPSGGGWRAADAAAAAGELGRTPSFEARLASPEAGLAAPGLACPARATPDAPSVPKAEAEAAPSLLPLRSSPHAASRRPLTPPRLVSDDSSNASDDAATDDLFCVEPGESASSDGSSGEEEEAKGEPVTPPQPDLYAQKAAVSAQSLRQGRLERNARDSSDSSQSDSGGSQTDLSSQSGSDEDDEAAAANNAKARHPTNPERAATAGLLVT